MVEVSAGTGDRNGAIGTVPPPGDNILRGLHKAGGRRNTKTTVLAEVAPERYVLAPGIRSPSNRTVPDRFL